MTFTFHPSMSAAGQRMVADATAKQRGLTREILAEGGDYVLDLMVRPDADLDGTFEAYDLDEGDFITINGWLFVIEPCD